MFRKILDENGFGPSTYELAVTESVQYCRCIGRQGCTGQRSVAEPKNLTSRSRNWNSRSRNRKLTSRPCTIQFLHRHYRSMRNSGFYLRILLFGRGSPGLINVVAKSLRQIYATWLRLWRLSFSHQKISVFHKGCQLVVQTPMYAGFWSW